MLPVGRVRVAYAWTSLLGGGFVFGFRDLLWVLQCECSIFGVLYPSKSGLVQKHIVKTYREDGEAHDLEGGVTLESPLAGGFVVKTRLWTCRYVERFHTFSGIESFRVDGGARDFVLFPV